MGEKWTLSEPAEGLCPLCRDEQVTFKLNKAENPMIHCSTLNCTVNMREGERNPHEFVREFVSDDAGELSEAEEEPKTLADLFGREDES
jgi:hypothetical protein